MANGSKEVGIDTGTPGFEIDGLSRAFEPVEPGQPGVGPVPTSHGDISVDDAKRDLSRETRTTLADYLGRSTRSNRFPVDRVAADGSITTQTGVPSPLRPSENARTFVDRSTLDGHSSLKDDPREALRQDVSVGRTDPQRIDGNELLPNAERNVVRRYTSTVLSNNRFTQDARSVAPDVDLQSPDGGFDTELRSPRFGDVSLLRQAQVAGVLSLRSSREAASLGDGLNPSSLRAEAAALLPSANQLGVPNVETATLRARDVLESLTTEPVDAGSLLSVSERSWGQLNNVDDRFSGFGAIGMVGLSAALTSAVLVAFEGLAALVGIIAPSPPQTQALEGRYILGRSTLEKKSSGQGISGVGSIDFSVSNLVPSLLGIRPTVKPFSQAVRKGVEVYFGLDSSLLGALRRSASSPGHNIVVARAIVRSSVIVLDTIKGAFKGANVVSGARNVLNIVDSIRTSKFIAAANVFAQLGDAALTDNPDEIIQTPEGEPIKKSRIDSIPDNAPGAAASKSRFNEGRTKLAWASNATPSVYMLPTRILGLTLANKLEGFQTGYGLQEKRTRSRYKLIEVDDASGVAGRIPQSTNNVDDLTVKRIESELEAEYVPFYFHDLRTNEIVSFHAFLSSLNESLTPEYEQFAGFGRVDAVQIYKSTKRSITLRFSVIATSEDDFNDMWVKLNKLSTLVYPQYTQGRTLSTDDHEFVQPFSQMMGASPMIRMRIGDLIKSNYSRFALARLFGAGTKETLKLNGQTVDFKLIEDQVEQKLETLKRTEQRGWYATTDGISVESLSLNLPAFGSVSTSFAPTFKPGPDAAYLPVRIVQFVDGGDAVIVEPEIINPQDLVIHYGFTPSAAEVKVTDLFAQYANQRAVKSRFVGGKYKISSTALRPSPMLAKSVIDQLSSTVSTDAALRALHEFMDPSSNALVKSFESVKGKGLAGFITQLDIDWMDKVVWELTPGSKAPKMCTISISYQPVHDVSPGVDHFGFNRAPIWPVGWYTHGYDEKG